MHPGPAVRRDRRWTSATSPPATTTGSRCGRATSSPSWPAGSASSAVPILRGREVVGFAQDDTGVDVELSDGHVAAGGVPRRLRRRTQPGPQGGRHRLPRVGSDDQLDDRRGRDGRGAGVRHPPRRLGGHRSAGGSRSATASGPVRAVRVVLTERARRATRASPPCEDLREALVAVYGTDFGVHSPTWISRFTDMTRQAASYRDGPGAARRRRRPRASPAGRPGPQHRRAGCREPGMEAGPGGQRDSHPRACWTPTTPNGIRSVPGCCATPWRRSRLAAPTTAPGPARHHDRTAEHGRAAPAHRRDALRSRRPLRPRRGTPAARAAHARPRPAHRRRPAAACSPCCTTPGPCCSTSASPAASTSPLGRIESGWSTPTYDGVWELPVLGEVAAPPAVLIRPDGHVAWAGDLTDPELPDALTTWFGPPAAA